jgi:transcriptional regulator with XRE-family HTH domain
VPAKPLGDVVRELRESKGLTQAQLAERAQIALSFITLIEAKQNTRPSTQILQRIARALGVPPKRLEEVES